MPLDAFLSHLLRNRMIRKDSSGELPTFAAVFEHFFGEEHKISKTADSFEQHIAGYFGWVDYGNMKAAYTEFSEIQAFIRGRLDDVKNKGLFDEDHPQED